MQMHYWHRYLHGEVTTQRGSATTRPMSGPVESDSRHVYAEYQLRTGEWSSVTDGNGANNSCNQRGPYTGFTQHRTCEAIDFWADDCGNYVFP